MIMFSFCHSDNVCQLPVAICNCHRTTPPFFAIFAAIPFTMWVKFFFLKIIYIIHKNINRFFICNFFFSAFWVCFWITTGEGENRRRRNHEGKKTGDGEIMRRSNQEEGKSGHRAESEGREKIKKKLGAEVRKSKKGSWPYR